MVSEKKKHMVKQVGKQLGEYSVVGILDMHKLPARQLHEIRNKLRGQAVIRMVKKRLIQRAMEKQNLGDLAKRIQGEPALFLTKENPFKMARVLQKSKSPAPAKPGDIAPREIIIPAGPTNLSPGPVIGELQKVKIPAGVEGEKIVVKKDTVLVKEGDEITPDIAAVLSKLEIQPMEVGLNLVAVWEEGTVYDKDILFIPEDHYPNQITEAVSRAQALSIAVNYITRETIPILVGKAHREAAALALAANVVTPDTIGPLLAKAQRKAAALVDI